MRTTWNRVLSLAVAAAAASSAWAADTIPSGCKGTLSGEATATFTCSAYLATQEGGQLFFTIGVLEEVAGIPSLVPGTFLVPGKPEVRTYTLDDLGYGKASVAADRGRLFTATKTSGQRGEVTLTITSLKKSKTIPGAYDVRGTYRARLVRVGGGSQDEVVVDVKF